MPFPLVTMLFKLPNTSANCLEELLADVSVDNTVVSTSTI